MFSGSQNDREQVDIFCDYSNGQRGFSIANHERFTCFVAEDRLELLWSIDEPTDFLAHVVVVDRLADHVDVRLEIPRFLSKVTREHPLQQTLSTKRLGKKEIENTYLVSAYG